METYYYLIEKKEVINNEVLNTPIGYSTSSDEVQLLNKGKYMDFINWINSNLTYLQNGTIDINSYFLSNQSFHFSEWKSTSIDGLNLSLVANILDL
jgi:hypothetical protein